jgi:hypothetical protein
MPAKEQQTCGKGLAQNSVLPAKLSELIASLGQNLERHIKALDLTDENSKLEYAAYEELAKQSREIATRLSTLGQQMAGYKDLPMGRHNEKVMSDPKIIEALKGLIKVEDELMSLLQKRAEQHRKLLAKARGARSAAK